MIEIGTTEGSFDEMRDWWLPIIESRRAVDLWSAAAFADLLDGPQPVLDLGSPLPLLWH